MLAVAGAIVERGAQTGLAHGNNFCQWHGPNDKGLWLGQSHGSAGILQRVLAVPELLASNATAVAWLRRTFDHIVSVQFPSGNFPTEYYNTTQDVLVQWDHGAPGVSAALLAAWAAFGDAAYRRSAERALEMTWTRGLLFKGLMNCHGWWQYVMQLYAARMTGDAKYLPRPRVPACCARHAAALRPTSNASASARARWPWQFWTGSVESAVELWGDLLSAGRNASETGGCRSYDNVMQVGWPGRLAMIADSEEAGSSQRFGTR